MNKADERINPRDRYSEESSDILGELAPKYAASIGGAY
jgi:hypothetical protein